MYRTLALPLVLLGLTASYASADETDLPIEVVATHVVTGKVAGVYRSTEQFASPVNPRLGYTEISRYVVEIAVADVEKGKGIRAEDLMYVRLVRGRHNIDAEGSPEVREGHSSIPHKGDNIKVFLQQAKDRGYDVLWPDGWEVVSRSSE